MREVAESGVAYISAGLITHSAPNPNVTVLVFIATLGRRTATSAKVYAKLAIQ